MNRAVEETREKDWINIVFFTLTPIIGVVGTALYTWHVGFHWWMAALFLVLYAFAGVSITAGYHRFFSHKSYDCSPLVQAFFAFFGAFAAQHSILWWSSGHRIHHKEVDSDWDPYSISRGFWWAHILWLFYKNPGSGFTNVPDLEKNPIVAWQHRWHRQIMILGGFGIPTAIGWMFGDPIAGLLWGGFTRLVVLHQTTFFVNSLAHTLGVQTFDREVSARDNWLVALVTFGEGYHSFHHRFPADFRNGIRWYHWDPSKWLIRSLRLAGLASNLRSITPPMVEQAKLQAALLTVETRIAAAPPTLNEEVQRRIANAREALEHSFALWRQHTEERAAGLSDRWRQTRRSAKLRLKQARREWRGAIRMLSQAPDLA
jgi:stearoyl-CoA desaturase (delta-9 desaturase)